MSLAGILDISMLFAFWDIYRLFIAKISTSPIIHRLRQNIDPAETALLYEDLTWGLPPCKRVVSDMGFNCSCILSIKFDNKS